MTKASGVWKPWDRVDAYGCQVQGVHELPPVLVDGLVAPALSASDGHHCSGTAWCVPHSSGGRRVFAPESERVASAPRTRVVLRRGWCGQPGTAARWWEPQEATVGSTYRVVIRGPMPMAVISSVRDRFEDVRVSAETAGTVIECSIPDQAALRALLTHVWDVGGAVMQVAVMADHADRRGLGGGPR
jgi:hypothetical protein